MREKEAGAEREIDISGMPAYQVLFRHSVGRKAWPTSDKIEKSSKGKRERENEQGRSNAFFALQSVNEV